MTSIGIFPSSVMLENMTHTVFHGFGAVGGSGVDGGGSTSGGLRPAFGKHCVDLHQRLIPHGVHFVPGPDECTLCACDDGSPKWCKAVLCSPPSDCKSFRVGNSCCDFICLDDSLNSNGPNTGGPYLSRPVEIANFVPKVVIAAVTAMLSLSLLFFLIHRLRQRHIQGRLNSARARRSTQMCDECDDTRSLDFSNDFFEHRMNSPHLYPPQYLAWWKPPSSYFPPRGEAPPPYEEALTTTSIGAMPYNNNNLQNNNNHNQRGILSDIPIIVPPSVLPPGAVTAASQAARSPAIARLASAIASTTNLGGNTSTTTILTSSIGAVSQKLDKQNAKGISQNQYELQHTSAGSRSDMGGVASSSSALKNKPSSSNSNTNSHHEPKKSERKSKSSKAKDKHQAPSQEPQPGPSRTETDSNGETNRTRPFRMSPPRHGAPPPTYEDAIYSLHPGSRDFYRHSLTLPPRRFDDNHLYPSVIVRSNGSGMPVPITCYTEDEINNQRPHHNQRYSLQFNVGGGPDIGGDWSSSSSTLSLSTTPNSPVGRPPSLSSSSESSVSESNPPPPSNNSSRA